MRICRVGTKAHYWDEVTGRTLSMPTKGICSTIDEVPKGDYTPEKQCSKHAPKRHNSTGGGQHPDGKRYRDEER